MAQVLHQLNYTVILNSVFIHSPCKDIWVKCHMKWLFAGRGCEIQRYMLMSC